MTDEVSFEVALGMARMAMNNLRVDPETAVAGQAWIPDDYRSEIVDALHREIARLGTITIEDLRMLEAHDDHQDWLRDVDRQGWVYWPALRQLLLDRGWDPPILDSLDDATDRILGSLENPRDDQDFDRRGLVVGYVQSGKTANYSALAAKAADTGYRLFIVLTGMTDQLRQQTQRRLNAELVGSEPGGVPLPRDDRRWLPFTTTELKGDFNPGTVDTAALAGGQPALIVAKKNGPILRRLNEWLDTMPPGTRNTIPVIVIDDEADQASPNTRGNRPFPILDEDGDPDEMVALAETPPSRINEYIRALLRKFHRVGYVGYTATPFANVLIDHRAGDRVVGDDLYPRSFIVDLPRPPDYYGPERIFGSGDDADDLGMDVIRNVPDGSTEGSRDDLELLIPPSREEAPSFQPAIPPSLVEAMDAFVLAGAARYQRGDGDVPASMLVHTTHYTLVQQRLDHVIVRHMTELRNDWRYNRHGGLEDRLRQLWDTDFRRVTRSENVELDVEFARVREHITTLLEHPIEIVQLNSASEDILDYTRDPSLKVLVVGGNSLSRGLTLEGLLVSYYVRRANAYDTLMQMGRWFGYRRNYADLTRIYTTEDLEQWFRDLVQVEADLRKDIRRYEEEDISPLEFGVRIRRHPAMLITDRLKMRAARDERLSFAGSLVQTVVFPFEDLDWIRANVEATREFLHVLGPPAEGVSESQPMWRDVSWEAIVGFLERYQVDPGAARFSPGTLRLLREFIARQSERGELVRWIVGVMGQRTNELGQIDLNIVGDPAINLIERSRLDKDDIQSLGVITSPVHLGLGLSETQLSHARGDRAAASGDALRAVRDRSEGLLLIYPIARTSGWHNGEEHVAGNRRPIYAGHEHAQEMENIIGIALAMPPSSDAATVEYVVGTVGSGED